MATIIGGNGLGHFDTQGQANIKLGGNNGLQINASSGNLVLHHQDQTLVSKGLDLSLVRTYNSQGQQDGNGDNWRFSFEREIQVAGSVIKRVSGDGHASVFHAKGSGYESTAGAGAHDSLIRQGKEWVYEEGSTGVKEYYDADSGRMLRAEDRFGNQTHYQYQGERLTAVQSASGEELRFIFNPSGQLVRVDSWTQETEGSVTHSHSKVYYDYDAQGRLSTVKVDLSPDDKSITDGQVLTTRYAYQNDDSHLIQRISKSNGSVVTLGYETVAGKPHLSRIDDNGIVTLLDYQPGRDNGHQLKVTDVKGQAWYYAHDEQGRLVGTLSPEVRYDKDIGRDGSPVDERLTGPTGEPHATRYHYDSQNNLVAAVETGALGERVTEYQYDEMGNCTVRLELGEWRERYEYDEMHRLVATHINNARAGEGHRYALYDGVNLRYEINEAGLVSEYVYDGFGQRTHSRAYVNAAFIKEGRPSINELAKWTQMQDKSQAELTTFNYQRGLVHTQTRYEQLDDKGDGLASPSLDVVASNTSAGVWLGGQRIDGSTPGVTLTHFDAEGKLVSSQTFNTHQNEEQSNQLLSELVNLRPPRDSLAGGRIYLSTQGQWASELLQNHLGLVLNIDLALNLSSVGAPDEPLLPLPPVLLVVFGISSDGEDAQLLDEQSAIEGSVSLRHGGNEHIRFTYDAFGQLLASDTLVGGLESGTARLVSSATQVYDGLGRVISHTDAQGVTTTTEYLDRSRQVVVSQASGTTVTQTFSTAGQLMSELRSAPTLASRERQFIYNTAGQLVATQHPDGGEQFQFYDAQGRLWVTVSELGAVTEYRRDPQGRVAV
ncbi:DUF6531 domain-containing protein, partial [Vibrio splendidus]